MIPFLVQPVVAIFVSLTLGYLLGKLRFGSIQLGGVCGTLLVALAIGQFGVKVSSDLKDLAFAIFIYALGFTAGPQFFANVRSGWRFGIFSVIEVVTALLLVALVVVFLHFDPGTAAGLFAGSATESAVLGTASDAIGRLPSAFDARELEANLATAYSITYIFGLVAIVVFVTQIAPLILRIDLKESARKLAKTLGADEDDGDTGLALPSIVGRAFVAGASEGRRVGEFEAAHRYNLVIEQIARGPEVLVATPDMRIEPGDVLIVVGRHSALLAACKAFGDEVPVPADANVAVISKAYVLTSKAIAGHSLADLRRSADPGVQRGVFISAIRRLGLDVPALPGTKLQRGDVITLFGTSDAVERVGKRVGPALPRAGETDYVLLGLGLVAGLFIGRLGFTTGAMEVTLGSGGGALLAGLAFGWLHLRFPQYGALPAPAASFMKDFGLATFIAIVGLSAGPDALKLIQRYGFELPILGLLISGIPAAVSLFVGTRLMKIEPPLLLGAIAGQHCSTPTISALVSQSGSSIPVIGYTITYAISNVLLPLMGPVVVSIAVALQRAALGAS